MSCPAFLCKFSPSTKNFNFISVKFAVIYHQCLLNTLLAQFNSGKNWADVLSDAQHQLGA